MPILEFNLTNEWLNIEVINMPDYALWMLIRVFVIHDFIEVQFCKP